MDAGPVAWKPRSGRDRLAGCVWLGRLLDKARATRNHTLGEYLFGKGDYLDGKLLHFLGLGDSDILEIVATEPSDERAARRVLARANKSPEDCVAFNRRFLRTYGPFLAMLDADEGRTRPTFATKLMTALYNLAVYPLGRALYRRHKGARQHV